MPLGDFIGYGDEAETCVVCGKAVRSGEALVTMHREGHKFPICCPLCLEAYQADPNQYFERLAKRALAQTAEKLEGPDKRSPL